MKKYISITLITFFLALLTYLGIYIYNGREIYIQSYNKALIDLNLKKEVTNNLDDNNINLSTYKNFSTDFYTFYYPEDYFLSALPNYITFTKNLKEIAKLKIINLKSEKFEDFQKVSNNYFFTTDKSLGELQNIPEFYNSFLINRNETIKKNESEFYISSNLDNEENNLKFRKYKVTSYDVLDKFKFISLSLENNDLEKIIAYTDGNLLIIGELNMPSVKEYQYFTNLITFTAYHQSN